MLPDRTGFARFQTIRQLIATAEPNVSQCWRCKPRARPTPACLRALAWLATQDGEVRQRDVFLNATGKQSGAPGTGGFTGLLNELWDRGWLRFLPGDRCELTAAGKAAAKERES